MKNPSVPLRAGVSERNGDSPLSSRTAAERRDPGPIGSSCALVGRMGPGSSAGMTVEGRGGADDLAPHIGDGHQLEIRMRSEERVDLRLVLLAEQRAGGVDQAAAGFHQAPGAVEDVALDLDQFIQILLREFPLGVGVAAPGAGARTGRIDQHAVEAAGVALDPGVALAAKGPCAPR